MEFRIHHSHSEGVHVITRLFKKNQKKHLFTEIFLSTVVKLLLHLFIRIENSQSWKVSLLILRWDSFENFFRHKILVKTDHKILVCNWSVYHDTLIWLVKSEIATWVDVWEKTCKKINLNVTCWLTGTWLKIVFTFTQATLNK